MKTRRGLPNAYVDQISENIYMQYFLGYSSFTSEAPFDASLFVEFRKRLGMDTLNAINEKIATLKTHLETEGKETTPTTGLKSPSCLLYTSPSPRDRTRSRM